MSVTEPFAPPLDRSRRPPFEQLDPKAFERFACALFENEPTIAAANLFNVERKRQFGIDVEGERKDRDGIEVASCKRYAGIAKGKIGEWSDDFLKHWDDRWSTRQVRRFVLVTSGSVDALARREEIERERSRFARLGVAYEVWGPAQLQEKLRAHRGVATQFLGGEWADIVCGSAPRIVEPARERSALISAVGVRQIAELQSIVSGNAIEAVEIALQDLRTGRMALVEDRINKLRAPDAWHQLTAEAQASVLRLRASFAVQTNAYEEADRLREEADTLFLSPDRRLAARIAYFRDGPAAALHVLGNPENVEGRRLLAALLIENGDLEAAEALLADVAAAAPDDPETNRLLAYGHLVRNRREDALSAIRRAEVAAPDWVAVVRMGAIVRYAQALSPALGPEWFLGPHPVSLDLVREDEESRAHLMECRSRFDRLLELKGDPADEVWKLACHADLRDDLAEAESFCRTLLARSPGRAAVVAWGLARGFDFDRETSRDALRGAYRAGDASSEQVRALLWLYLEAGKAAEAVDIFLDGLPSQSGDVALEAESCLRQARDRSAGRSLGKSDDVAVVEAARATSDWSAVEELLEQALASRPPAPSAMMLAQALAGAARWRRLIAHVDALLSFETAEAVRLAAFALHVARDFRRLLNVLDAGRKAFGGELPFELRRMRLAALGGTGDLASAMTEADTIARATNLPGDRLARADLLVAMGDTGAALPVVREALRRNELEGAAALRWASVLRTSDADLSRQLWRSAMARGISDRLAGEALAQAFALGLDAETDTLFPALQALARDPLSGVRLLSIDDLLEQGEEMADARKGRHDLFLRGAVPAHIFCEAANVNFATLYDMTDHQEADRPLSAMLLRHGARPKRWASAPPWRDWRLHIDLSGLLVADQLDLLDHVERLPTPAAISPSLPRALLELETQAAHNQPSRVASGKAVVDAVAAGRIAIPSEPDASAIRVAHEPEAGIDGTVAISVREVFSALAALGAADVDPFPAEGPGSRDEGDPDPLLRPGERLLFTDGAIQEIASAGMLGSLLDHFEVEVEAEWLGCLRAEVAAAASGDRLRERLHRLRRRVRDGLQTGAYVCVPPADGERRRENGPRRQTSLVEDCLLDLLSAPAAECGVLWADDRYVTGYPAANGNTIVGVVEVLDALRRDGGLSREETGDRMRTLRTGGAVFVPYDVDEVLEPLGRAKLRKGRVVETPALAAVRRNLAASHRAERGLDTGNSGLPVLEGRPLELPYLVAARRLVLDCLQRVWNERASSHEARVARSDWLWSNLRCEIVTAAAPSDADPGWIDRQFSSALVASAFDLALAINLEKMSATFTRHAEYARWVDGAIFAVRHANDPEFAEGVAEHLRRALPAMVGEEVFGEDQAARDLGRMFLQRHVETLPRVLRSSLLGDPSFTDEVGLSVSTVVHVGQVEFPAEDFWVAVQAAMRNGSARVCSSVAGEAFLRRRGRAIRLSGAVDAEIVDEAFVVLAARRPRRRAALLEGVIRGYDLPAREAASVLGEAAAASTAFRLAKVLNQARRGSVEARFAALEDAIGKEARNGVELLDPLGADKCMHHLRWAENAAAPMQAARDGIRLLVECGLEPVRVFERYMGLPFPTMELFGAMVGDPARRGDIVRMIDRATTPVALIHAAALRKAISGDSFEARTELGRFVASVAETGPLFVRLLRRTALVLGRDRRWRDLPHATRLALVWAHADRTTDTLVRAGADLAAAPGVIDRAPPSLSLADNLQDPLWADDDCAAPTGISPEALLFHGLGQMLDGRMLDEVAGEQLAAEVRLALLHEGTEAPGWAVLMRSNGAPNAMGSFLDRAPAWFGDERSSPETMRGALVEMAFEGLGREPGSGEGWMHLLHLSASLPPDRRALVDEAFERANLSHLALMPSSERSAIRAAFRVRISLGTGVPFDRLLAKLIETARACAASRRGRLETIARDGSAAANALGELFECAAVITAASPAPERLERFAEAADAIARVWPDAAPAIRELLDGLTRSSPARSLAPLWAAYTVARALR